MDCVFFSRMQILLAYIYFQVAVDLNYVSEKSFTNITRKLCNFPG